MVNMSSSTSTLTKEERNKRWRDEYDRKMQKMVQFEILEPKPGKKGSYQYTDKFFKFWEKEIESSRYDDFVADYILDYEDEIRQKYWRMLLWGYEEEHLDKKKRNTSMFGPSITDDDIIADLSSSLTLTEEEEFERIKAMEAARTKAATQ